MPTMYCNPALNNWIFKDQITEGPISEHIRSQKAGSSVELLRNPLRSDVSQRWGLLLRRKCGF